MTDDTSRGTAPESDRATFPLPGRVARRRYALRVARALAGILPPATAANGQIRIQLWTLSEALHRSAEAHRTRVSGEEKALLFERLGAGLPELAHSSRGTFEPNEFVLPAVATVTWHAMSLYDILVINNVMAATARQRSVLCRLYRVAASDDGNFGLAWTHGLDELLALADEAAWVTGTTGASRRFAVGEDQKHALCHELGRLQTAADCLRALSPAGTYGA